MNNKVKSILIYFIVAAPIMLLTDYALHDRELTSRQVIISLVGTLIIGLGVNLWIGWIGKQTQQQGAKSAGRKTAV